MGQEGQGCWYCYLGAENKSGIQNKSGTQNCGINCFIIKIIILKIKNVSNLAKKIFLLFFFLFIIIIICILILLLLLEKIKRN